MQGHLLIRLGCRGRNAQGQEVLAVPAGMVVELRKNPDSPAMISANVVCHFNTGAHGQRCKASHPNQDKVGDGVGCPFSFDYPYAKEQNPHWKPPQEIAKALEELAAPSPPKFP